jgi:hypothetical protein
MEEESGQEHIEKQQVLEGQQEAEEQPIGLEQ